MQAFTQSLDILLPAFIHEQHLEIGSLLVTFFIKILGRLVLVLEFARHAQVDVTCAISTAGKGSYDARDYTREQIKVLLIEQLPKQLDVIL